MYVYTKVLNCYYSTINLLVLRANFTPFSQKVCYFLCWILVNCLCYYNTYEINGKFSLSLSQFHETQDRVHHRESSWKIAVHEFHIGFISFYFFPFIEAVLTEMTRYTNQCLNLSTVNILWILNQFKQ